MKNIIIFISLLITFQLHIKTFASESSIFSFNADVKEGFIGTFEDKSLDNPSDNVFTIELLNEPISTSEVWLSYELFGVSDHNSVSRSINNQMSVGGQFVSIDKSEWSSQKEQVNPKWLKKGQNIVRFSIPNDAKYNYKIRNLKVEIENKTSNERAIITNLASQQTCNNKSTYVKGFVKGTGAEKAKLFVNDKNIETYFTEFEALVNLKNLSNEQTVHLKAIFEDGETIEKEITLTSYIKADISNEIKEPYSSHLLTQFIPGRLFQSNLDEVQLAINPDALNNQTNISISALRGVDMPPLDAGMVNVTKNEAGYRFLPHGTQFNNAANLSLAYDEKKIPQGYTAKDIRTYFFDEVSKHWKALPTDTIEYESGMIVSKTTHFTDMINAVIQVPESPETGAHTPTSIKDIKAADPSANINVIQPPSANNMGNANLGYPIVVPPGRQGMQPQLGIQYNSGGGNGWLGLGWDLSIPQVSIDTRWGVPRYDADNETETYMLNGQQLTPVAHRGEFVARTSDKQFYPRVEGSFNKIIRKGNDPASYWWEITDKSGTVYKYGTIDNSTLKTSEGYIANWALVEVRDLNNNFVRYHYTRQQDTGVIGGQVAGFETYVNRITYTGTVDDGGNDIEGKYEVLFKRDRENGEAKRKDITIDARLGFKRVTADLLREIKVNYNDQAVRSYELSYITGAFEKTLLKKITEFDAQGNYFNEHTFDYYDDAYTFDDINNVNKLTPLGAEEKWETENDQLGGDLISGNGINKFNNPSVLGTNTSTGWGIAGAITVGLGFKVWSKLASAGGNLGFDSSNNKGLLALVDIDGDGLPDKIFEKNGALRYRPNNGDKTFGDYVNITGINQFSKGKSNTFKKGLEAHFGIFAGYTRSNTNSFSSIYFSDVNGDLLVDIVNEGIVYFNHLNNGVPTFEVSSENTDCTVCEAAEIDVIELEDDTNTLTSPLHDVVKVWIAPYDGTVNINAPVTLGEDITTEATADGITATVQHNENELIERIINANDFNTQLIDLDRTVTAGDRIYFRLHSKDDGFNDAVFWNPIITYDNAAGACGCGFKLNNYNITCNGNNTFAFQLDVELFNPTNSNFSVLINGAEYGPFEDVDSDNLETITISNVQNISDQNFEVEFYITNNPSCNRIYQLNITELELVSSSVICTSANTYDLQLEVLLNSLETEEYRFFVNIDGTDYGPFLDYTPAGGSESIQINNLTKSNNSAQVTLSPSIDDKTGSSCGETYEINLLNCDNCLQVSNITPTCEINPEHFTLVFLVDGTNAPGNMYNVNITYYGNNFTVYDQSFNYTNNSVNINNVLRSGNYNYTITISDVSDPSCYRSFDIGDIDCSSQKTASSEKQSKKIIPGCQLDASNNPVYKFTYADDFILSSNNPVGMPLSGTIDITGLITKDLTSDNFEGVITKNGADIESYPMSQNALSTSTNKSITVAEGDILTFELRANSNIDWTEVKWNPEIEYTAITDASVDANFDASIINLKPTVEHTVFNKIIEPANAWYAQETGPIEITPTNAGSDFVLTVKKPLELLTKRINSSGSFTLQVEKFDKLYFDYHYIDEIDNSNAGVIVEQNSIQYTPNVGVYTTTENYLEDITSQGQTQIDSDLKLFGSLYRSWGQFAYNSNDDTNADGTVNSIDEGEIVGILENINSLTEDNIELDLEGLENCPEDDIVLEDCLSEMETAFSNWAGNPLLSAKVIMMNPNFTDNRYEGQSPLTYVKADSIRSSRFGNPNISNSPVFTNSTAQGDPYKKGAKAIKTLRVNKNNSIAINAASISFNHSWGNTEQVYDYLDMNGDRHPDIVSFVDGELSIQYTTPTGGLEALATPINISNLQKSTHNQTGIGIGGEFATSSDQNSNNSTRGENAGDSEKKAKGTVGFSGNMGTNYDSVAHDNMDINGDGLPDRVYRDGKVELNLGYTFTDKEFWGSALPNIAEFEINTGSSQNAGIGGKLGINKGNGSFKAGVGLSTSSNKIIKQLVDVNGDGLLDIVGVKDIANNCDNINGDFETHPGDPIAGNDWINNNLDNWCVSHGSPSLGTGVAPSTVGIWMWAKPNNNNSYGEGVFTNYNFEQGKTYTISYYTHLYQNTDAQFKVELVNDLNCYGTEIVNGGIVTDTKIPNISNKQNIITQTFDRTGNWQRVEQTFTAEANYSKLWMYPYLDTNLPQAEITIDNVCINEHEEGLVRLNTGNGFSDQTIPWEGLEQLSKGKSIGESASGAITFGPTIFGIKFGFNPSGDISAGISKEKLQIRDVDGDGYPDYVYTNPASESDKSFKVKRSTIGRTNMLKQVFRPLGANFALDYERIGNTYAMPNSVWALSKVSINDGFTGDGADNMRNTFEYEDGFYHRCEREFYGFKEVKTHQHNTESNNAKYRSVVQTFINNTTTDFTELNDIYHLKGMLASEIVQDAADNLYTETSNNFGLNTTVEPGSLFPIVTETRSDFYEGGATAQKFTTATFAYDDFGNVTNYTSTGDNLEAISSTIQYHEVLGNYIVGTPSSIIVTDDENNTLRQRETTIDGNGNVTQIRQFLEDESIAQHNMTYFANGNLRQIKRPTNATGQRLFFDYTYDSAVQTYVTGVSDTYGYSSSNAYDFRFGQMLTSTDINGNIISYTVDDAGRISEIRGPFEQTTTKPTIRFDYFPDANIPYASTKHFDPSHPTNDLETVTFMDGLMRPVQVKKDAHVHGKYHVDAEKMIVSGKIIYDAYGRTIETYYPVTEDVGTAAVFNTNIDTENPTQTTYDVLDRPLSITLPDASTITNQYGFGNDRNGTQQFQTQIIDANGIKKKQFTNSRGLTTATWEQLNQATNNQNPWLWTSYIYNPINELMSVMDDPGDKITYQYDWFGRRLEMDHPDGGITSFEYDLTGNVTSKVTANLEAINQSIDYTYDFERLTNIAYPQNPQNDVSYIYGGPQAVDNRRGRIMLQTDATGEQRFAYNELGALTFNKRDVNVDGANISMTTNWEYDTWNRLTKLTYPDGEELTYNYNLGGMLNSMSSTLNGVAQDYVKQLGYDKFEQNVYVKYGNNTETTYTYEADRRRLQNLDAKSASGSEFMKNTYTYDKVGNIKSITNVPNLSQGQAMGGASSYKFTYDDMYRLTKANGNFTDTDKKEHKYTLGMNYNNAHAITRKSQTHTIAGSTQDNTAYEYLYKYEGSQPHAPTTLMATNNNIDTDRMYTYDANGNQLSFSASGCEFRAYSWDEENRLMLVTDDDEEHFYTYDANGDRIIKNTQALVAAPNPPAPGSLAALQNYTVYMNPYVVVRNGAVTKHFYTEGNRICSKLSGDYDVNNGTINEPVNALTYYFHPDHLGNSSYISDASGEVSQHIEYFPFGEVFIEEQNNTYNTPYLFNAKELDDKTGLYYYGARYYDPVLSNWLSVDPLASSMPEWSPYNYTFNNPLVYTDPDGRHPVRLALTVFKITKKIRRAAKRGKKLNVKDLLTDELMDIIEDGSTILDPKSTPLEKILALVDLVSGLDVSKLSNRKVKKQSKFLEKSVMNALDGADNVLPAATKASQKVKKSKRRNRYIENDEGDAAIDQFEGINKARDNYKKKKNKEINRFDDENEWGGARKRPRGLPIDNMNKSKQRDKNKNKRRRKG